MALPAFWAGLLYDASSLAEASALTGDWTPSEVQALRDEVPRLGLKAPFRGGTVQDVARDAVAIADRGLKRRGLIDADGDDERKYLAPLLEIAAEGRAPADRLLHDFETAWNRDIDRLFDAQSF
jgi:glutamate--cysteine ligase